MLFLLLLLMLRMLLVVDGIAGLRSASLQFFK